MKKKALLKSREQRGLTCELCGGRLPRVTRVKGRTVHKDCYLHYPKELLKYL